MTKSSLFLKRFHSHVSPKNRTQSSLSRQPLWVWHSRWISLPRLSALEVDTFGVCRRHCMQIFVPMPKVLEADLSAHARGTGGRHLCVCRQHWRHISLPEPAAPEAEHCV